MQDTIFQLAMHASFFVKVILFVLLAFSIGSWAVIAYKYEQFSGASRESAHFLDVFESAQDLRDLADKSHNFRNSPIARLFQTVWPAHEEGDSESVKRVLRRHQTLEEEKLHSYLTFLATTGSTTPFIGLLGTVWGIINAFRGIGATGSASLAVVAPGIAEALITTAAGLAAAIPAVMAYNYYVSWARRMTMEMEDFAEQIPSLSRSR